jgi:hypothetical protein
VWFAIAHFLLKMLLFVVVGIGITHGVLLYGSNLLIVARTNYVRALFIHNGSRALDLESQLLSWRKRL